MTIEYLSASDVAERLSVQASTIRAYVARDQFPEPDVIVGHGPHAARGWLPETIEAWQASRPGPGRWGRRATD